MDFSVQFCEYNYSNPDYDQIYRPKGSGDYLFLLFKTPMKVYLNHQLTLSKENACILYAPGYEQHYKAVQKFRNSYLHFSCEKSPGEQFGIPLNTIFYPANPEDIDSCIRCLQKEHITNDLFSAEYEYSLFCQLMITVARGLAEHQLHGASADADNLYSAFRRLRLEMLHQLCRRLGYPTALRGSQSGKSQFYTYYQKFFQSTPHADLLQIRMDKAKNLLTNQALPVQQIALACGFSDYSHFSRYFKRQFGCSPTQWRRKI